MFGLRNYLATIVWGVVEQIFPILDPCGSAVLKVLLQRVPTQEGGHSVVVSNLVVVRGSLWIAQVWARFRSTGDPKKIILVLV